MKNIIKIITILFFISNACFVFAEDGYNFNEVIKCEYPTDPEPEIIPLYEKCSDQEGKIKDPILKWACSNGFIIKNSCRDGVTFLKDEYFYYKGIKNKVTYKAKANLLQSYDTGVPEGTFNFYKDFPGKGEYSGYSNAVAVAVDTYHFCDNINKDNKEICQRFKKKGQDYFDTLLSLSKAVVNGETPKQNNGTSDQETTYTLTATKKGYNEKSELIFVDTNKVGKIIIKGNVKSATGKFLPNATVSILHFNKKVLTDNNGNYEISFKVGNKEKIQYFNKNFVLKSELGKIKVKAIYHRLIANGKKYPVILILTKDNHPLANKKVEVLFAPSGIFYKNGKKVDYLNKAPYFDKLTTDVNGKITLYIQMPYVIKSKLNTIISDKSLLPKLKNNFPAEKDFFPVSADIKVEIPEEKGKGVTRVSIESPFPRIVQYKVPGNLEAGLWQTIPSVIQIEDFDSRDFTVEIKGIGKFKTRGGEIYPNGLYKHLKGKNKFEFYFASNSLGIDLNKQPDLWKELINTNMKIGLNFCLAVLEGYGLEEAKKGLKVSGSKTATIKMNIPKTDKISSETVTSVGKLGIGGLDYYSSTVQTFYNDKKDRDYVATADWVVGGISLGSDTISLITRASSSLKGTLQLEALKAVYENAKTIYYTYKKYRKITDSYQGLFFIPITAVVSDPEGHKTIVSRPCGVRMWTDLDANKFGGK